MVRSPSGVVLLVVLSVVGPSAVAGPSGSGCGSGAPVLQALTLGNDAASRLEALKTAIVQLKAETEALPHRVWSPSQIQEVRDQTGLRFINEQEIAAFYKDRLRQTLENLRREYRNIRTQQIMDSLRATQPSALNFEGETLGFISDGSTGENLIHGMLRTDKFETVTPNQLGALYKIKVYEDELKYLEPDIKNYENLERYRKELAAAPDTESYGPYRKEMTAKIEKLGKLGFLEEAQKRVAFLKSEIPRLMDKYFPKGSFEDFGTDPRSVRRVIWNREWDRSCCGGSCPGCPIQRKYMFHDSYLADKKKQPKGAASHENEAGSAGLVLFQVAPQFGPELVPISFDKELYNLRHRN